jgi:hypothetical protein
MGAEPPGREPSEKESPARASSLHESQAPAFSQWLQLMLAEISARREALERARAEEARRNEERAARPADSRGGASQR